MFRFAIGSAPTGSSNENKMSDGGRERALLGAEGWKSFQKWSVCRSAVRSIAWLDLFRFVVVHELSNVVAFFRAIRSLNGPIDNL